MVTTVSKCRLHSNQEFDQVPERLDRNWFKSSTAIAFAEYIEPNGTVAKQYEVNRLAKLPVVTFKPLFNIVETNRRNAELPVSELVKQVRGEVQRTQKLSDFDYDYDLLKGYERDIVVGKCPALPKQWLGNLSTQIVDPPSHFVKLEAAIRDCRRDGAPILDYSGCSRRSVWPRREMRTVRWRLHVA